MNWKADWGKNGRIYDSQWVLKINSPLNYRGIACRVVRFKAKTNGKLARSEHSIWKKIFKSIVHFSSYPPQQYSCSMAILERSDFFIFLEYYNLSTRLFCPLSVTLFPFCLFHWPIQLVFMLQEWPTFPLQRKISLCRMLTCLDGRALTLHVNSLILLGHLSPEFVLEILLNMSC